MIPWFGCSVQIVVMPFRQVLGALNSPNQLLHLPPAASHTSWHHWTIQLCRVVQPQKSFVGVQEPLAIFGLPVGPMLVDELVK